MPTSSTHSATIDPVPNNSGRGAHSIVPEDINGWNWGAFLLNWIWAIGNRSYIYAFLMFVPFINFVVPFVLGRRGNSLAWQNQRWESIEHFKSVQQKWRRWSFAIIFLVLPIFAMSAFGIFVSILKNSEAFRLAVAGVEASPEVAQILGTPVSTGIPTGTLETSGPTGKAAMSFSVEGPDGDGTVYFVAVKELGQWKIQRLILEQQDSGRRVDLMPNPQNSTSMPPAV